MAAGDTLRTFNAEPPDLPRFLPPNCRKVLGNLDGQISYKNDESNKQMKTRILSLITLLCAAMASSQSVHAVTITVTNTNDSGFFSLRQALADANDGDTINFLGVSGTITLTSGELLVNKSITISGPGANTLAVNGNAASRVFHIASGKTVTISDLTVTNGNSANGGGGIYNDHATLTVSNTTLSGNSTTGTGGGIYNNGSSPGSAALTVTNSTLSGNSAFGGGGGIYNNGNG